MFGVTADETVGFTFAELVEPGVAAALLSVAFCVGKAIGCEERVAKYTTNEMTVISKITGIIQISIFLPFFLIIKTPM